MKNKSENIFVDAGKMIPLGDDLTIKEVNTLLKPFLQALNYEERVKLRSSPAGESLVWIIGEVYRMGYWCGRVYKRKTRKQKKMAQIFEYL